MTPKVFSGAVLAYYSDLVWVAEGHATENLEEDLYNIIPNFLEKGTLSYTNRFSVKFSPKTNKFSQVFFFLLTFSDENYFTLMKILPIWYKFSEVLKNVTLPYQENGVISLWEILRIWHKFSEVLKNVTHSCTKICKEKGVIDTLVRLILLPMLAACYTHFCTKYPPKYSCSDTGFINS